MNIKVDFTTDSSIDTELLTSIRTLCSTYEGTIPLDRRVGLDSSVISESIDISKEIITADIFDKVEKYIPEVEVIEVSFKEGEDISMLDVLIKLGRREDV
ncbi:hypothetical protein [Lachnoanaerobaculum umeaense]|jgi:hypothetical protein|uniref:Uncharacterized protein n=1 Tax=Lachnoanaerobaculum umeaense TaxID=617123 RepID=A0A385Q3G0_9FIRM|nr:hypothetical protein [Lachnoanaerobaculum umeaense]AYB00205.1 hypothetical protein D4A81_09810 [Lachnoanaerobaculum umeaense]PZW96760.1 hypothetical protein C7439_11187 [Lachnoanaerobaculum umeaense]